MNNLKGRTYFSVIGTLLYIWIFLFIPAWSLHFWQAWIFWFVFSIPVIGITLYFLKKDPVFMESRLKAGPIAEKEKSQKWIQLVLSFFFLSFLILPGLDFRYHWSSVSVILVVIGDLFVLLGFWMVFLVFKENSFASATIEINKNQKVISTGLYKYIRHPMYAGAALLVGVMPIALGSYWTFLFVIPMGIGVVLRILNEEKYLQKNLVGYTAYCKKVPYRLIPFVW